VPAISRPFIASPRDVPSTQEAIPPPSALRHRDARNPLVNSRPADHGTFAPEETPVNSTAHSFETTITRQFTACRHRTASAPCAHRVGSHPRPPQIRWHIPSGNPQQPHAIRLMLRQHHLADPAALDGQPTLSAGLRDGARSFAQSLHRRPLLSPQTPRCATAPSCSRTALALRPHTKHKCHRKPWRVSCIVSSSPMNAKLMEQSGNKLAVARADPVRVSENALQLSQRS